MIEKAYKLQDYHVVRIEENRIIKCLLYCELEQGFRYSDCPKNRFKDYNNKVMSDNLEVGQNWKELVQDRKTWRQKIVKSAYINQNSCRQQEAANRQLKIKHNDCIKVYGSRYPFKNSFVKTRIFIN